MLVCPASVPLSNVPAPCRPREISRPSADYPPIPERCSFRRGSLLGRCRGAAVVAPLALPLVAPASLGLVALRPPPLRRPPASSLCLVRLASGGRRCGPALTAADAARAGPTLAPPRARCAPALVGAARLRFARGACAGVGLPPLPLGLPLPAAVLRTAVHPGRVVRPPRANPTVRTLRSQALGRSSPVLVLTNDDSNTIFVQSLNRTRR